MIRQKLFVQSNASSSVRTGTVCSRKEKEQGELGLCKLNSEFRHICVAEPTQVSAISIQNMLTKLTNCFNHTTFIKNNNINIPFWHIQYNFFFFFLSDCKSSMTLDQSDEGFIF